MTRSLLICLADSPFLVHNSDTISALASRSKRTAEERAASPIAGEPTSKRVKPQEEDVEDDSCAEVSAVKDDEEDMDDAALPAEIAGTSRSKIGVFKEEPYIYLPEDDEAVKTCM